MANEPPLCGKCSNRHWRFVACDEAPEYTEPTPVTRIFRHGKPPTDVFQNFAGRRGNSFDRRTQIEHQARLTPP